MGKIRVLSPEVVARIAAGEVVERPAAVVKELVENSLDAGAAVILVEARGGGVGLVQVTDDGCGIAAEELETAFERHATSKVSSIGDLESITSLGFRGEALPSIAAVAEVEVTTCTGEGPGKYLHLAGGEVMESSIRARSRGTTMTVRNLFRSVPARLKFLRSPATENSHIANVVTQYALAYPEVKFTLTIDGSKLLSTPGNGELGSAVLAVYGLETARNMMEIRREAKWGDASGQGGITVSGLVGAPSVARSTRDYMSFFVNRRWISGKLLSKAVEDAYRGLLMVGKHPVSVINIEVPPSNVDVNIHPAKSEVKFQNESAVFGAVQRAVRSALLELPTPVVQQPAAVYHAPPAVPLPFAVSSWESRGECGETQPGVTRSSVVASPSAEVRSALPALRPVGQVAGTYIVAEGPDGLYLIDQHAAHERIRFEAVKAQRARGRAEVQGLLEPMVFETTPRQDVLLKGHLEELAGFGFSLEAFGTQQYLVRTVPAGLNAASAGAVLREILDGAAGSANWEERLVQTIACHSAVRAGQALSEQEMRELVRALEQTELPHTCPHGRPTVIHLSLAQLEKEFRRT